MHWEAVRSCLAKREQGLLQLLYASFANTPFVCFASLALAEMKTLLRDVYLEFSTTPHVSMTEKAMAMSEQLISSRPLGQKCLLHFTPISR